MSFATDPFIPIIASTLSAASATDSLGWTVVQQNSPNRKEWNNVPLVIVCPSPKNQVSYICFGKTKTVNAYDCFLVTTADLASNFNNTANNFYQIILKNFMPQITSMAVAGAYQSRVIPRFDYDRTVFPTGWVSSCVQIDVFNVNQ